MNHCFKLACALLVTLWLTACASLMPAPDEQTAVPSGADWRQHAAEVASLDAWFLKGRIAIRTEREGWNATLHWRQQTDRFTLRVLAPLGQGTVELQGGEHQAITLVTSDNQRYSAADAESLMRKQLGWSVPVEGLKYWVRGLPAPGGGISSATPDEQGRIRTLEQQGWHIEFKDYTDALDRSLPRKLEMVNERLELKLVVQSWEPLDA